MNILKRKMNKMLEFRFSKFEDKISKVITLQTDNILIMYLINGRLINLLQLINN